MVIASWPKMRLVAWLIVLACACRSKTGLRGNAPARSSDDGGPDGARVDASTDASSDVSLLDAQRDALPPLPDSAFDPDSGDAGCRPSTELVDLLLMVDASGSMVDERTLLSRELPRLVGALLTGDVEYGTTLPGRGTADFPRVQSLHVGLVSADLATGTFGAFCLAAHGGDGIIGGRERPGFLTFNARSDPEEFSRLFNTSTANLGRCPIEQSLDSMLKALVPTTCTAGYCAFEGGSRGQADRANVGFLRDESLLGLVVISDEDDCSAQNPLLFCAADRTSCPDPFSFTINLRCSLFLDELHPVQRYVSGFSDLKDNPRQLVYATVGGFPPGLGTSDGQIDYGSVLARDDMQIVRDPINTSRILPACEGSGGPAVPARRLLELGRQLEFRGTPTVAQSICEPRYDSLVTGLMRRIAERALETCDE